MQPALQTMSLFRTLKNVFLCFVIRKQLKLFVLEYYVANSSLMKLVACTSIKGATNYCAIESLNDIILYFIKHEERGRLLTIAGHTRITCNIKISIAIQKLDLINIFWPNRVLHKSFLCTVIYSYSDNVFRVCWLPMRSWHREVHLADSFQLVGKLNFSSRYFNFWELFIWLGRIILRLSGR